MSRLRLRIGAPTAFVLGCVVSLLASPVASRADNGPHAPSTGIVTDSCALCHRLHTAQGPRLLKDPQKSLCYACHGSSSAGANTDVEDGVGYSGEGRSGGKAGALRGGGFKYALIGSSAASGQRSEPPNPDGVVPVLGAAAEATSTHSIDSSQQTAWGNGPVSGSLEYGKSIPLRCGSCHDPHGNGNYRTLRPIPKDSGAGSGVSIPDATNKVYTTENYWQVADANAAGFIANISSWCATCHTRYLSPSTEAGAESGDAVFTQRHRTDQTAQGSSNCIQCHVAHGSNATSEPSSGGVHSLAGVPAPADGYLLRIDNRGVCQMCHEE